MNKGFGISQKYAGSGNWFRPHILWSREHELQKLVFFPELDRPILFESSLAQGEAFCSLAADDYDVGNQSFQAFQSH